MNCPYCNTPAKLLTGREIYPHRPDLYHKRFWSCRPCDAYVGCHQNTEVPLGRLANRHLRSLKMAAHEAFDPIWKAGSKSRNKAYEWLAEQMSIPVKECHIGMFNESQCELVIRICTNAQQQGIG